jgi:hypothetical protein
MDRTADRSHTGLSPQYGRTHHLGSLAPQLIGARSRNGTCDCPALHLQLLRSTTEHGRWRRRLAYRGKRRASESQHPLNRDMTGVECSP